MKENGSDLEEIIREELQKEAEDIRETVESSEGESLSEDRKEKIRENLQNEIQAYEKEKVYEQLSQEDREALELGRQIQRERQEDGKRRGGRRIWKIALNLAAALVLVSVLGITSLGGPERIVEMVRTMVGDREVVKVNSDEDNLKIAEEREEEAYQEIKDTFGVDPVRIVAGPQGLEFMESVIDTKLQTAELFYQYKGTNIVYFVNASYTGASWSVDTEDKVVDTYYKEREGQQIEIKEYQVSNITGEKYSASFKYHGLEYYLIGSISKEDFEEIIDNLYFFS